MKRKPKVIPIEKRYSPIFTDGQNVLYLNGNHVDQFYGHSVPADAFFGWLKSGLRFIAVVKGSKVGMVSFVWPNGWENTFHQDVLDFLVKAGITFSATTPKEIYTTQDLLCSNVYPRSTVFHPFCDYILFLASHTAQSQNRSYKDFQISTSSMELIKNISNSLFFLEQEYIFLKQKNDKARIKKLNHWYAFFGYKFYPDSKPSQNLIFHASTVNLFYLDIVYLKSANQSSFFHNLILESARQLKKQPLTMEDKALYQKAVKLRTEKKKPTQSNQNPEDKQTELSTEGTIAPAQKSIEPTHIPSKFNYEKHTLYVHQGIIKCTRNHHRTVCVTANIPTASNIVAVLNVNLCQECRRFFISYDEYARYLERYKSLLTRIVLVNGNGSELFSGNFAEASPLKLCGYSVSKSKGFSQQERENLLAEVIHNGIMSKPDVIQYLNWFIKMNGHKTGNSIAKEKWESDLVFVRSLDIKKQTTYTISNVAPYKRHSKK